MKFLSKSFHGHQPEWLSNIVRGPNTAPLKSLQNVVFILKNDISENLLKRNLFANRDVYGSKTPWHKNIDDSLSDEDIVQIKLWLGQKWGFEPNRDLIYEALLNISLENKFDPIIERFNLLPEWDQIPRIDSWLANYFEAKGHPEYLAQVFTEWLVAMIARALKPGVKFDWMPILEGKQNTGKSTFGRKLVGDTYFLDWLPSLSDKDSAISLQGTLLIEFGELVSMRRNEIEIVKANQRKRIQEERLYFADLMKSTQMKIGDSVLETVESIIELANNAESLWIHMTTGERKQLLDKLLSNRWFDGLSMRYEIIKPLRILSEMKEDSNWRRGRDSNPRDAINAYTLSKRAPSATRPPIRLIFYTVTPTDKSNAYCG